jgi:phage shock protein E
MNGTNSPGLVVLSVDLNNIIMKNLLVALVLFLTLFSSESLFSQTKLVSPKEFKSAISSGVVVDVRTPEEFNNGHLQGASNINFYDANFNTDISKIDKAKTILIYCQLGGRSHKAVAKLSELGFSKIIELDGGYNAWKEAGY